MQKRLGDYLIESGLIDNKTLAQAIEIQKIEKKRLGRILRDMGAVDDEMIAAALSKQLRIPLLKLHKMTISQDVIALVPQELAEKNQLIPVQKVQKALLVAMADPVDMQASDDLRFFTGLTIQIGVASEGDIERAIPMYYAKHKPGGSSGSALAAGPKKQSGFRSPASDVTSVLSSFDTIGDDLHVISQTEAVRGSEANGAEALARLAENPPIVRLSKAILADAIQHSASDVHIEPQNTDLLVRFRIDGLLREMVRLDKSLHAPLVSRIKILSQMDISERRRPQDGRYRFKFQGKDCDLRVSTMPTLHGEKVVLRILNQSAAGRDLTELGMSDLDRSFLEHAIGVPQGIILITGPTGSGKTSTLYALLNRLKSPSVNIVTIEDPIEYEVHDISQVQVNPRAGLTFASGLRTILRQDPDIVMVGEIRDAETAAIAFQAAQTGHLVLSSLHTNDAPSAVTRLMDLSVPAFLISSSLTAVVGQRLVRRICPQCKAIDRPSLQILEGPPVYAVRPESKVLWKGTGCDACQHIGYSGRLGIYEILTIASSHRDIIIPGVSSAALKRAAEADGFKTMTQDGLEKAFQGLTTVDEVWRVAPPDPEVPLFAPITELDLEEPGPETSMPLKPPISVPGAGPRKILVVTDNEVTSRVLRTILEAEDYLVVAVKDGIEALKTAQGEVLDLVVTDFLMPGMDGYTLVKKMKSQSSTRQIPIMMLTGKDELDSGIDLTALGVEDCLVKPINPQRLLARVRRLLVRQGGALSKREDSHVGDKEGPHDFEKQAYDRTGWGAAQAGVLI
jgi:type IV pilus assembly protein PilB